MDQVEFLKYPFALNMALIIPIVVAVVIVIGCGRRQKVVKEKLVEKRPPEGSRKNKPKKVISCHAVSTKFVKVKKGKLKSRKSLKGKLSRSRKLKLSVKEPSARKFTKSCRVDVDKVAVRQDHISPVGKNVNTKSNIIQYSGNKKNQTSESVENVKTNRIKKQNPEPLIPTELQLLNHLYSQNCLVLTEDQPANIVGRMFRVPQSLPDSAHEMEVEPAELRWTTAGGIQKISIVNQTSEHQAIKIKCSDDTIYRVNPVISVIEPGQILNVNVMRQNGSKKIGKIVFIVAKAPLKEIDPGEVFKVGIQSSTIVLPLALKVDQQSSVGN